MRFFRRFRPRPRPSLLTVFTEDHNRDFICQDWINFNTSPLQKNQSYVPKVLSDTSASDILTGAARVEDFSAGCWLQNRLHQFGDRLSLLMTHRSQGMENHVGNDSFDDQTGSDIATEASESDSLDNSCSPSYDSDDFSTLHFVSNSISRYQMVQEPPPYGFIEPPPSYEEATGIQLHVDCSSMSSASSDFVLY